MTEKWRKLYKEVQISKSCINFRKYAKKNFLKTLTTRAAVLWTWDKIVSAINCQFLSTQVKNYVENYRTIVQFSDFET